MFDKYRVLGIREKYGRVNVAFCARAERARDLSMYGAQETEDYRNISSVWKNNWKSDAKQYFTKKIVQENVDTNAGLDIF